jgi:hypothetical protein
MRKGLFFLVSLGAFIAPINAMACGGFFCNASPVDQQAERIIFVQEDDDTVTSYVEIAYQGEPEGFAWIVPVPSVPELDTWHGGAFNAIDLATQPQFNFENDCFFAEDSAAGGGGGGPMNANGGVDVLAQERVGPFDTVTIQSDDPRELVEWLRLNEYRIVPEMEPFIALYTAEGMKFLAMKLAPGEDSESIEPIKMTYAASAPAVPLRLTSIAAQLEMGVKIWILSEQRFGPQNVPDVVIPDDALFFDPRTWRDNYLALVARKIDAHGGHGFVTELAAPSAPLAEVVRNSRVPERFGQEALDARDALVALLESKPYITRLYSRVSPAEMDIDPIFHPVDGGDVSNVHLIPAREGEDDQCGRGGAENDGVDPCEFIACGAGGLCAQPAENQGQVRAGCACAPGMVARAGVSPDGQGVVACGDARLNFTGNSMAEGTPQFPDICALGDFCGDQGECVMLNGFPSCRCEVGHLAIPVRDEQGMWVATCVAAAQPSELMIEAIEIREPNLPYPGRTTPMTPMPVDMEMMDDSMDDEVDDGEDTNVPAPSERMVGTMTSSSDGGCATISGGENVQLWWLVLPFGLFAFSRRRR